MITSLNVIFVSAVLLVEDSEDGIDKILSIPALLEFPFRMPASCEPPLEADPELDGAAIVPEDGMTVGAALLI